MEKRERVGRAMLGVINASAGHGERLHEWESEDDREEALQLADALIELWDALSYLEGATLLQSTVEHVHSGLGFREAALRAFTRWVRAAWPDLADTPDQQKDFETILDEELADVVPDGARRAAPAARPPGQG